MKVLGDFHKSVEAFFKRKRKEAEPWNAFVATFTVSILASFFGGSWYGKPDLFGSIISLILGAFFWLVLSSVILGLFHFIAKRNYGSKATFSHIFYLYSFAMLFTVPIIFVSSIINRTGLPWFLLIPFLCLFPYLLLTSLKIATRTSYREVTFALIGTQLILATLYVFVLCSLFFSWQWHLR